MNVLIINLTRFGDLLQMQPVILGLKAQGHAVGLICLDNFAPATVLLQGLDYVCPLSGGALLRALTQAHPEKDGTWFMAVQQVDAMAQHVARHFPVDMLVNTTATLSSRLLARRLTYASSAQYAENGTETPPILGFGLDAYGFGESGNMWSTFLQGASAERLNCPFNLVDMFRSVAHVADFPALRGLKKPEERLQQSINEILSAQKPENCRGFVAFQLGASDQRRQWPIQSFVKLGARLWEDRRLCPLLLGSKAEERLAQSYTHMLMLQEMEASASAHPYIDLIGKTDILQLAASLSASELLVSNDTGTMHLAAGLDVPVIGIFLSTAQAFDTGPYVVNACCLEPAMPCHPCAFQKPCAFGESQPCLQNIDAELVGDLAVNFLEHGAWDAHDVCRQDGVRIWRSEMDEKSGFMTLCGLSGHENEERSHWLHIQRYFYRHILDNDLEHFVSENTHETAQADSVSNLVKNELAVHVAGLSREFRNVVSGALDQCTKLLLLLQEHMLLVQRMPSKNSGARIVGICNTIYGVLEKCPPLKALGHLWLVIFQERGAKWESFAELVILLRGVLLFWLNTVKV